MKISANTSVKPKKTKMAGIALALFLTGAAFPTLAQTSPYVIGLDAYGHGYIDAVLQNAKPAGISATIRLPSGEIQLLDGASKNPKAASLRLTRGEISAYNLNIGKTTAKDLTAVFGAPYKNSSIEMVYRGPAEICEGYIVFAINNSVLQGIEWKWCYD